MKNDNINVATIYQLFTLERDIEMFAVNPLGFVYLVAMFDKIL